MKDEFVLLAALIENALSLLSHSSILKKRKKKKEKKNSSSLFWFLFLFSF